MELIKADDLISKIKINRIKIKEDEIKADNTKALELVSECLDRLFEASGDGISHGILDKSKEVINICRDTLISLGYECSYIFHTRVYKCPVDFYKFNVTLKID